jgi:hypothetical protein
VAIRRGTFRRLNTDDEGLNRVQAAVAEAFQGDQGSIFDGAIVIDGVQLLVAAPTVLQHGLGRPPLGYLVLKQNANATIWDTTTPAPASTLKLLTDADVTVTLLVF